MNYIKILFCVLTVIFTLPLKSQQISDTLNATDIFNMSIEELLQVKVSVSSTIPTNLFESPSNVTLIEREQIDQYNFLSVAEAVRQVAGVEMLQTVIDKNVPTIRGILQNFYANKVLIMINNIPVWHPTYGNSTLDRVNINDVKRIEVLKGPASVLYGTNAYSGVINIILRDSKKSELNAQISGGYPSFGAASVNYSQRKGDFSWNVSANSSLEIRQPYLMEGYADTLKIGDSYLYENDTLYLYHEEYSLFNLNTTLHYKSHTINFNSFVNRYNSPGINVSYKTGANKPITDKGTLISYTFDKDLSKKTHIRFNTHYDYHFRNQIQAQANSISAEFSSQRIDANIKINHNFSNQFKLEYGGEIFDGKNLGHNIIDNILDTIIQENIKDDKDIIEGSVFMQANYNYKWFSVIGGARYTHNRNFGGNLSPRVTTLFKLNKTNSLKIIFGKSFRTPNMLEMYFNHWSVVGNPDLKPETCSSHELMYLTKVKNYFIQLTTYYSKYDNLIQRTRENIDINEPAEYHNVGSFSAVGTEVEVKYQNAKIINAMLSYNFMQGIGVESESNFKYVPTHTIALGLNKSINKFFISANTYSYSEVEGTWELIPTQFMLDAHLGYKHKSEKGFNLTHTISFKNITDSDMLIPEYVRNRPGINTLKTTGYGRRFIYTLKLTF